jgi:hypothetical protein
MPWYLPDWLTGYDAENAARAAAADQRLRELNARTYRGKLAEQVEANYAAQGPITVEDQRSAITQAFREELNARADSIVGTPVRAVGEAITEAIGAVLRNIPTLIWLVAIGALVVYLKPWSWRR